MACLDDVCRLLHECRFSPRRSRDKAEKAIKLIESTGELQKRCFYLHQRGLVVFPDLLERYLRFFPKFKLDDYEAMVARCIEYKQDDSDDWHRQSLEILLQYPHEGAVLRLLQGKYRIDRDLYEKAAAAGVRDPCYEGSTEPYTLKSPEQMEEEGMYGGYRQAYHLILYGGPRRSELVDDWKRYGPDCTYEAACDYFGTKDKEEIYRLMN